MGKFILGGRLGDLIHSLYVVKNTPGKHDLYITDRRDLHSDGFLLPLAETIEQLRPVLMYQDYVNSVQAYEGPVTEATSGEWINLNMWRRWAYSDSWTNLLAKVYGVPVVGEAWMKWPHKAPWYSVQHRSSHTARKGDWNKVNCKAGFVYNMPDNLESISTMFNAVSSGNVFIGEQSAPLAIAHALDIPRIGVLNRVDAKAYIGEELIFKNFSYVI